MAYLVSNARDDDAKISLSDGQKEQIYQWNKADTLLYRSLNQTFWQHVENFGQERMEREKAKLRQVNAELVQKCFIGETSDSAYFLGLRVSFLSFYPSY